MRIFYNGTNQFCLQITFISFCLFIFHKLIDYDIIESEQRAAWMYSTHRCVVLVLMLHLKHSTGKTQSHDNSLLPIGCILNCTLLDLCVGGGTLKYLPFLYIHKSN